MSEIDFNDYFYYDETSPSCLRWKHERRCGIGGKGHVVAEKDGRSGCLSKIGYWVVNIKCKTYYIHRIIWIMLRGPIPESFEIDHINGVRS